MPAIKGLTTSSSLLSNLAQDQALPGFATHQTDTSYDLGHLILNQTTSDFARNLTFHTWTNNSTLEGSLSPSVRSLGSASVQDTGAGDGAILAKISLLLVVTALVLIASYKFVVRLFLGYTDRKDEVIPGDTSDDDDSAIVKRVPLSRMDFRKLDIG